MPKLNTKRKQALITALDFVIENLKKKASPETSEAIKKLINRKNNLQL